jgi:hypothetical protein
MITEQQAAQAALAAFLNERDPNELNQTDLQTWENLKIAENIEIYRQRTAYLALHNDRSHIADTDDDVWFGLNLRIITKDIASIGEIAETYHNDKFHAHLLWYLVLIHQKRNLVFHRKNAKAVAYPENPTISESQMNQNGVIIYGGEAYDLTVEVTLDKREYDDIHLRNAFALFFALKLSQVDLLQIDFFLDYQLQVTFENNFEQFKLFLIPLSMQYKTIVIDEFKDESINILSDNVIQLVELWLNARQKNAKYLMQQEPPKQQQQPPKQEELCNEPLMQNIAKQDDTTPPDNWKLIYVRMTQQKIKDILSFLYKEVGSDGKAFLTENEFNELLKYGFGYPKQKSDKPLKLALSTERTKAIIYYCFYCLYQKLGAEHTDKKDIVNFLINNFENFKQENYQTIYDAIKNEKPRKMAFDIFDSYINKIEQIEVNINQS